ncbi:UDP-2-acetamido-2,6-dideoxy-beta-L-talose 4-dehydrogenase [Steroidobacter agaridevorans]|uniref:UDP-2-acetamido-2,6-dideoxy-beta-L-talose 4-dehydrogenase n=1 Tax=Steroidobacter agaridevorans TaxID=2695856 RepID=A0A829YGV4_9GAMM|nr:NAD-dependent epimerase/dehydratase family protein [Steroidobacter agaridevorans]GFE82028.1 UDP-2-acetamido-2,6-dideoxy-beta-L-talose 4-dehydrogenase [Steroidobacter agaridevorans]
MNVLVTGANGFIGRNLAVRLGELPGVEVLRCTRQSSAEELTALVARADFIFHLAGVNRPRDPAEFTSGNVDLTTRLCDAVKSCGRRVPIVYASSIQAELDNPYGRSKLQAERELRGLHAETGCPVHLLRLPGVFGKWCRPDYNSVVATFCHNIARELPIQIADPGVVLRLVYIDDVVAAMLGLMQKPDASPDLFAPAPAPYSITLGDLAAQIRAFRNCRTTLIGERVGTGLTRALYATYVSYLPPQDFVYSLPQYGDTRGVFVEMLKTVDSGQFSYFTAHAGVTRGGHYHHTKTEKFLVVRGTALFRFRQLVTGEYHEVRTSGAQPQVVETIPGWTHDITNVGDEEMVVMLWANEIFDRQRPDTIAKPL